jgi:hypothetical protein
MYDLLFNTTLNVSPAELAFSFLLGVFLTVLLFFGVLTAISYRAFKPSLPPPLPEPPAPALEAAPVPTRVVVQPWTADGADLEPEPFDVAVRPGFRRQLELESAPMAPRLPKCPSLVNFRPWGLDDSDRTGAWPTVGGYDQLDVDAASQPNPLPGFEVGQPKRFRRSEEELSAAAVALGFAPRPRRLEPLALNGLSESDQAALIAAVVGR